MAKMPHYWDETHFMSDHDLSTRILAQHCHKVDCANINLVALTAKNMGIHS